MLIEYPKSIDKYNLDVLIFICNTMHAFHSLESNSINHSHHPFASVTIVVIRDNMWVLFYLFGPFFGLNTCLGLFLC